jgi:hypothetical protein
MVAHLSIHLKQDIDLPSEFVTPARALSPAAKPQIPVNYQGYALQNAGRVAHFSICVKKDIGLPTGFVPPARARFSL